MSVSTTLFLFIQTRELSQRLHDIQDPNLDLTAFEARIDSGKSGGRHEGGIQDITKPKSYFSRELSNEKLNVSFWQKPPQKKGPICKSEITVELYKKNSLKDFFKKARELSKVNKGD